jgi:hypothetical protein
MLQQIRIKRDAIRARWDVPWAPASSFVASKQVAMLQQGEKE